jgi:hypothetical protein
MFRIEPACVLVVTMLFITVSSSVAQDVRVSQAGPSPGSEPAALGVNTETNVAALPVRPAQKVSILEPKGDGATRLQNVKLVPSSATAPLLPVDDRLQLSARVKWENDPTPPAVRATPVEPPFPESGRPLPSSQTEPNAISLGNALAQPSGDDSTAPFKQKGQVQVTNDAVPRLAVNQLIGELVDEMPKGGGYRASSDSIQKLEYAIRQEGDHLIVKADVAQPSFCSSATYLVFVSALEEWNRRRHIRFEPGVAEQLLVRGQHDGVGVWGRWNANGPGTACLFKELQLGHNFTHIEDAQAGDFLKIFWNDQIGAREIGHSVVYLGRCNREGIEVVRYWSSNKNGGYGPAEVPRSKIKRMLFSRLEHPERINQIAKGLEPDEYLASMLVRNSTPEEMEMRVDTPSSAIADPTPATSVGKKTKGSGIDHQVDRKKRKNKFYARRIVNVLRNLGGYRFGAVRFPGW